MTGNFRPVLTALVIWAVLDYLLIPAWNVKSATMWFCIAFPLIAGAFAGPEKPLKKWHDMDMEWDDDVMEKKASLNEWMLLIGTLIALAGLAGLTFSSPFFCARDYSQILTVKEGSTQDIPSAEDAGSIALMDTASASRLGDREIGTLSDVVSQYDIRSWDYIQVNDKGKPAKMAPLSYAGPFKWYGNRYRGVPGYVKVDPVSMSAEYIKLDKGMKYVPSAWFGDDLSRRIRRKYRSTLFEEPHFETDDEGRPWYVAPVYKKTIFLFGGKTVTGAILADPVTGQMQKYDVEDIPEWVDVVFEGDLVCTQYDRYAQYQQGFWNAYFGQNGCRKTTADFGYIAKGTDIWIYTGVTSVNGDSSNLGFIMSNERTGETRYISCAGADELSAMKAAQGEVQEKGYLASFPSLVLIDNAPTYIMVLKDNAGLVKMYACVNIEQYNIVATAPKQADCITRYKALLAGDISEEAANSEKADETVSTEGWKKVDIVVEKVTQLDRDGNTYIYLADTDGNIYSARYESVIEMMLVEEGDTITILTDGKSFAYPAK